MNLDFYTKVIREDAILTTSYVSGDIIGNDPGITDLSGQNQLYIYLKLVKGSITSAQIKVEFSNDLITWYQESVATVSGGVYTEALATHTFPAVTGNYRLPIPIKDKFVRVSVKATGIVTASSAGLSVSYGQV